jgi:SAM-dependent methyltransferase
MNLVKAIAAWELFWWARRRMMRSHLYDVARRRADELGRRLVVVGAPDGGVTAGYGCGDITIDIAPSSCPSAIQADITKPLPFATDSVVVVVMCVLEYVDDANAALAELNRISGGNLFVVRVEPWTLTSVFYPGARRTLPCEGTACSTR